MFNVGEYDSRPPLARYVWCVTWYLRSSCCSEAHYAHVQLPVFLPLSTLDVTHVRKCTRPSPLYRTKQRRKAGRGTGNEAIESIILLLVTFAFSADVRTTAGRKRYTIIIMDTRILNSSYPKKDHALNNRYLHMNLYRSPPPPPHTHTHTHTRTYTVLHTHTHTRHETFSFAMGHLNESNYHV